MSGKLYFDLAPFDLQEVLQYRMNGIAYSMLHLGTTLIQVTTLE